jgi:hypothetical protein
MKDKGGIDMSYVHELIREHAETHGYEWWTIPAEEAEAAWQQVLDACAEGFAANDRSHRAAAAVAHERILGGSP